MIWTAVEIAAIIVESFMVTRLLIEYFGFKSNTHVLYKWLGLFFALVAIDCIGSFVVESEFFLIAGFVLSGIVYTQIFVNGGKFEKVVVSLFSYLLFYVINLPVLALSSFITQMSPEVISDISTQHAVRIIGIFATKALYFAASQMILTVHRKGEYKFHLNEWIIISSAFACTLCIGLCIHALIVGYVDREMVYVIITLLMALLDVMVFVFVCKLNRINIEIIAQNKLRIQFNKQQADMKQLEQQYRAISIMRHDHKNQLSCLKTLLEAENYDEANKYLSKVIGRESGSTHTYVYCSNAIVGAVINEKITEAQRHDITATCKMVARIPEYMEYDMSIMLSNLLDNALEACKNNSNRSQIILSITENSGYYRVVVKNTIDVSVLNSNRNLETNKKDKCHHGWGLKSVKDIAKKYSGAVDIYEKDNMFVVSVMLLNIDDMK